MSIFGAKVNTALDRMENPAETLDYSYEKQLNLLKDVRRGLAEIATSKQRLKMQSEKLRQQDTKLQEQAQQALVQGREDIARLALQRKAALTPQIESLDQQVYALDEQQAKLADASQKLQARIEMFRTTKEATKAQYTAAQAQVKINESFTGLSKEMGEIGTSLQRTQDRIAQMQARAGALDELIDSGALTDYSAQLTGEDDIDRQLRLAGGNGGSEIDAQLEAMKQQLAESSQPRLEDQER
jgi:phage shock protein A